MYLFGVCMFVGGMNIFLKNLIDTCVSCASAFSNVFSIIFFANGLKSIILNVILKYMYFLFVNMVFLEIFVMEYSVMYNFLYFVSILLMYNDFNFCVIVSSVFLFKFIGVIFIVLLFRVMI